ncbi:MAG: ERAP1-like C-terminal domain-containing protein, partial [Terriglobales bacterium]
VYIKKFAYGNATSEDFWRSLAEASMRPVDKIMPTFVEQPGAPLITVKASCVAPPPEPVVRRSKSKKSRRQQIKPAEPKTEIVVEQSRFWDDSSAASPSSTTWMVPLCVKTATAKPFCQIVSQKKQTIPATGCAPWVLANAGASGYYRTRYDGAVMQQLIAVAGTELTSAERVSLLHDEAALVDSGQESMARYLDLVTALSTDPLSAVLNSYVPTLDEIHRYLLTDADKPAFLAWVRAIFGPVFAQVGWMPAPGESDDRRSLRSDLIQIMGEIGEDPQVIRRAVELARQYMKDGRALDPSLAGSVLGVAALSGDAELFQQFMDAWRNPAATPEQRDNFARALTRFKDPRLAQRWLETTMAEARNQDAAGYIFGVLNNVAVNHAAWEWVKQHWPQVEAKLTAGSGLSVVLATGSFCEAGAGDD